jgi:hypothetical protein
MSMGQKSIGRNSNKIEYTPTPVGQMTSLLDQS